MQPGGAMVISLDLELSWGIRDRPEFAAGYRRNLLGTRDVVPRLLEVFAQQGIRATWATVGFLFFAEKEELLTNLPAIRPSYEDPRLSPYEHIGSIGSDERSDPLHYGASLVDLIIDTPEQEVATHTFSHYYSLAPGQHAEQFAADLDAAVAAAAARGVTLRSIVFPRNEVNPAYLGICSERGLRSYRGTQRAWMHRSRGSASETAWRRAARLADAYLPVTQRHSRTPTNRGGGLIDIPASRFFRPRSRALSVLEPAKLARIEHELELAARHGEIYHLWWHPHNFGVDTDAHFTQLERVLDRFARLRETRGMRSLTMFELAEAPR